MRRIRRAAGLGCVFRRPPGVQLKSDAGPNPLPRTGQEERRTPPRGGERLAHYRVTVAVGGGAGAQALGKKVCEATLLTCPRVIFALGRKYTPGHGSPAPPQV